MMRDCELIEQYRLGDREAFAPLVRRHIDWVYSVACRRTGDRELAEDVTQAVFVVLARKAPRLKPGQPLSAWLFSVARYACNDALRARRRREFHETEAARMRDREPNDDAVWGAIAGKLDAAVDRLKPADRQAVLLRFYERQSFAQVGEAVGISEEAARKRVERATARLREILSTQTGEISPTAIAGLLALKTVETAPAALSSAVSAGGGTLAATSAAASVAKGTVTLMVLSKIKVAAVAVAAALLLMGGAVVVVRRMSTAAPGTHVTSAATIPASASAPATGPSEVMRKFNEVYRLQDGEILRHIAPPMIPERAEGYITISSPPGRRLEQAFIPPMVYYTWNGSLRFGGASAVDQIKLRDVVEFVMGVEPYNHGIGKELLDLPCDGDWIIRSGATRAELFTALTDIIAQEHGRQVQFENRPVEQDVMVVSGSYQLKPLEGAKPGYMHVYVTALDQEDGAVYSDPLPRFLKRFGTDLKLRLIDETTPPPPSRIRWTYHQSGHAAMFAKPEERPAKIKEMFDNVSAQTGLVFTPVKRMEEVWHATVR